VTGLSALPRSQTIHAFFWSEETGKMLDLGTAPPGDLFSAGLAMNDEGDIVGASLDGPPPMGNARAVIWHNRQIADLNCIRYQQRRADCRVRRRYEHSGDSRFSRNARHGRQRPCCTWSDRTAAIAASRDSRSTEPEALLTEIWRIATREPLRQSRTHRRTSRRARGSRLPNLFADGKQEF